MARRNPPGLDPLEAALGYAFRDRALLQRALTHVSALSSEEARTGSYQRLEFLGDRVLGLAIAAMLTRAFPDAEEGDLSRHLAALVRKESCATVAVAWGVPPHLRLGLGFVAAGRRNQAILGDVCEAIIGAVYLDGGFEPARALVETAFAPLMQATGGPPRDAKTALQEWAQKQGLPVPVYRLVDREGPDHAPVFRLAAIVDGLAPVEGVGASKRAAQQAAAEAFLRREGVWNGETA